MLNDFDQIHSVVSGNIDTLRAAIERGTVKGGIDARGDYHKTAYARAPEAAKSLIMRPCLPVSPWRDFFRASVSRSRSPVGTRSGCTLPSNIATPKRCSSCLKRTRTHRPSIVGSTSACTPGLCLADALACRRLTCSACAHPRVPVRGQ